MALFLPVPDVVLGDHRQLDIVLCFELILILLVVLGLHEMLILDIIQPPVPCFDILDVQMPERKNSLDLLTHFQRLLLLQGLWHHQSCVDPGEESERPEKDKRQEERISSKQGVFPLTRWKAVSVLLAGHGKYARDRRPQKRPSRPRHAEVSHGLGLVLPSYLGYHALEHRRDVIEETRHDSDGQRHVVVRRETEKNGARADREDSYAHHWLSPHPVR
mmetsp:Transcript_11319/g.21251  ORF Transcript_11319/g.21251 Transcript_11319/m.21251 type:complete len:218 (-) Transcript_11319:347-1000(-)